MSDRQFYIICEYIHSTYIIASQKCHRMYWAPWGLMEFLILDFEGHSIIYDRTTSWCNLKDLPNVTFLIPCILFKTFQKIFRIIKELKLGCGRMSGANLKIFGCPKVSIFLWGRRRRRPKYSNFWCKNSARLCCLFIMKSRDR